MTTESKFDHNWMENLMKGLIPQLCWGEWSKRKR